MSETIRLNIIQKGGMTTDDFNDLFDDMIKKKNAGKKLAEADVNIIKEQLEYAGSFPNDRTSLNVPQIENQICPLLNIDSKTDIKGLKLKHEKCGKLCIECNKVITKLKKLTPSSKPQSTPPPTPPPTSPPTPPPTSPPTSPPTPPPSTLGSFGDKLNNVDELITYIKGQLTPVPEDNREKIRQFLILFFSLTF